MEKYITAELVATCGSLGYYDGYKYHLDRHCIDAVKDLIKYLRRDDDTHVVRRHLGQSNVVQTDLLRIFVQYADRVELYDVLLRLLINLTSPALTIYNDELPTEKAARTFYQEIVCHLQRYKIALTDDRVWSTVAERLGMILNIESSERGEDTEMTIERILTFIKNVLQIPPSDNEKRTDNDATVHDELLFALHTSGIVDLLLFVASNRGEQQYHMQILEIITFMLREQNAAKLASVGLQRSTAEKERDEAKLMTIRQKEAREKSEKVRKCIGFRHSRFGGTYVVQDMKAIGDNQLICHKPFSKIEALEFSQEKKKVKKPKKHTQPIETNEERISALSVRLFLKEFCVEFLNGAYNPVMRFAKSCINGGNEGTLSDGSYYFWALRFFMEFNRCYKFQVKYVSETVSTETFYLVQRQLEHYYEMLLTDKKKIPIWSRKLHYALRAYQNYSVYMYNNFGMSILSLIRLSLQNMKYSDEDKHELLHTLIAMDKTADKGVRDSSRVIKSNIFYVPEYRETLLSQLLCYDENKMTRKYLVDLVMTVHIFLKMLEQFCGQSRALVVRKARGKKRVKRKRQPAKEERPPPPSLDERWDDAGPELSVVMREGTIPEVVPFDATLDTPIDEQKTDAMKRIQKLLRLKDFERAIGLLRAAREVWSENDCFGAAGLSTEEEFLALREIFFADLGVPHVEATFTGASQENASQLDIGNSLHDDEEYSDEEEEGDEERAFEETDFKFADFLHRFANLKVVKACAVLLGQFESNTPEVNHGVTKLLHRISWDCKMPAMVFQASIFRIFQRILESRQPEHKEMQKFAVYIVRQFTEVARKNVKAFMELLFWKTTRDATEMVEGYDSHESKKVMRTVWSEAEEDELRALFMEHQTNKYPQDLIDWLLERIINENRTRRAIIKKLKEMCLIVNSKAVRSEVQKRLPKEWSEEEIAQLTEIWEQVKEDDDPVELVYVGLRVKRPKPKIKDKLLELGLAEDRKQLRKKRSRKSNPEKASWETRSPSPSDDEGSSEAESAISGARSTNVRAKPAKARKVKKKSSRQPVVVYTDAQLSGLLKDVIEQNMGESLKWLQESLEDALEDRDEESSEGIPLVPLTDYSSEAIDSPSFQRLLRAIGIESPADEQESYWRIPANMLSATIRKRCSLIAGALAGTFVEEEERVPEKTQSGTDSESDSDVFERVKTFFKPKPLDLEEDRDSVPAIESSHNSREDNTLVEASSDTEEDKQNPVEAPKEATANASTAGSKVSSNRNRIRVADSSDSEKDEEMELENVSDDIKRTRVDSSDTDVPLPKRRRVFDSDEEDDSERQPSAAKEARGVISEDDDND